jgi:hypothetical protein
MEMENAINIVTPDPYSQYRLKPCKACGSDNVAYVKYLKNGQLLWAAACFDCGNTVDSGSTVKHDAQRHWNGEE